MRGRRLSAVAFHKRLAGKTEKEKERLIEEEAKLAQEEDAYLEDLCGLWDGYLNYKSKEANKTAMKRKFLVRKAATALKRSYLKGMKRFLAATAHDAKAALKEEVPDNEQLKEEVKRLEEEVATARSRLKALVESQDECAIRAREFEVQELNLTNGIKERVLDMRKHQMESSMKAAEEIIDHCKWTSLTDRVGKVENLTLWPVIAEIPEDPIRAVWIELERERLQKMRTYVNKRREYALELEQKINFTKKEREEEVARMNEKLFGLLADLESRRKGETQLAQLRSENVTLQLEFNNLCEEVMTLNRSMRAYTNEISRVSELEEQISQAQKRCTDLQAQAKSKRELLATKRAKNDAMRKKIDTCRQKLSEYQRKLSLKDKKIDLIQQQITQVFNGTYKKPAPPRQTRQPAPPPPKTAKRRIPLAPRNDENTISNHAMRTS